MNSPAIVESQGLFPAGAGATSGYQCLEAIAKAAYTGSSVAIRFEKHRVLEMMIYLAGPVFTLAERRFNEELACELERLCPSLQVFLPQRYDKEFQNAADFSQRMFACLMGVLDSCSVVIAVLDGPDADSGTSFEMGYARGRGKRVIGVRTDFRGSEDHGVNLMLSNACSDLLMESSTTTTLPRLAEKLARILTTGEFHAAQRTSEVSLLP